MNDFNENAMIRAIPDQVSCDLSDETVVLSFKDDIYYGMNAVGAFVWKRLLEGACSIRGLREAILCEFEVEPPACARDLDRFLSALRDRKLIEVA